jgi:hypothetical protein
LPCETNHACPTVGDNVGNFRRALVAKDNGRSVECRRGELGRCGQFRYFDFDGEIERHELQWFDAAGTLVGQRNSTDYAEYCGGRARIRYQGRIPMCDAMEREEVICGSADYPLPRPIEDVLKKPVPALDFNPQIGKPK